MTSEKDLLLAAEYALGILDGPATARVDGRLRSDDALGQEVAFWEDHLATTLMSAEPIAPPRDMLDRVEGTLFGRQEATAPARRFSWKGFAVGIVIVKLALVSAWWASETPSSVRSPGEAISR